MLQQVLGLCSPSYDLTCIYIYNIDRGNLTEIRKSKYPFDLRPSPQSFILLIDKCWLAIYTLHLGLHRHLCFARLGILQELVGHGCRSTGVEVLFYINRYRYDIAILACILYIDINTCIHEGRVCQIPSHIVVLLYVYIYIYDMYNMSSSAGKGWLAEFHEVGYSTRPKKNKNTSKQINSFFFEFFGVPIPR